MGLPAAQARQKATSIPPRDSAQRRKVLLSWKVFPSKISADFLQEYTNGHPVHGADIRPIALLFRLLRHPAWFPAESSGMAYEAFFGRASPSRRSRAAVRRCSGREDIARASSKSLPARENRIQRQRQGRWSPRHDRSKGDRRLRHIQQESRIFEARSSVQPGEARNSRPFVESFWCSPRGRACCAPGAAVRLLEACAIDVSPRSAAPFS